MKLIAMILTMSIHQLGSAAELTPREWVGFLHQVSKRGAVEIAGDNVAFTVERRTTDGNEEDYIKLIGLRDTDGEFMPTSLVQVERVRQENGILMTATKISLVGEVTVVQSRLLTPKSSQKDGEPPEVPATDAQRAEWKSSLEAWRAQVANMRDRVGRYDAKEVAI